MKKKDIEEKIAKLEKLANDKRSNKSEKDIYNKAIGKLKVKLKAFDKDVKKDVKKIEKDIKKDVKKIEKKVKDVVEPKKTGKVETISTKKVAVDGKEMEIDSAEFCDHLVGAWKTRIQKAKDNKAKGKKTKTSSVMAKVSTHIEKSIEQAIKAGVKDKKAEINKDPKKFILKVEKLEKSTETYLHDLKDVMGREYDSKEVESTIKSIKELVAELKKKLK